MARLTRQEGTAAPRHTGWAFVADRLPYVLAFFAALGLALAVFYLEQALAGVSLPLDLPYIGLLAALAFGLGLLYDYGRQRRFRKRLEALRAGPPLEAFAALSGAVTQEQHLVQEVIRAQHRAYLDELAAHRARQEQDFLFLNRWAHQMKTPLSVIDLTLEAEEKAGRLPPEVLADLREESDKLADGLELLLSSIRLGDFRADFVVRRTDLTGTARRAINNYRRAFIRRHVYPVLEAPADPVWVETDEKWLSFILGQLLSNAVKYSAVARQPVPGEAPPPAVADASAATAPAETPDVTAPGEVPASVVPALAPRVTVRVIREPGACRVEVADQGVGIPPEDLGRVFDPFFTGANGRLYPEATGMGLYLARTVADRLGHRLSIVSERGRGTTAAVVIRTETTLGSGG